jgi:hypothetical protein
MLDLERIGYVLWESVTLVTVLSIGLGFLALRRIAKGRPGFSADDRHLFFGNGVRPKGPRMMLKFVTAGALCFCSLALEVAFFLPFGAALLTGIMLLTSMAIVAELVY